MDKKILATIELAEHEVRLIVGQFYNGRLNILKVEKVAHHGIKDFKIVDTQSVRQAIIKSVSNASENVGGEISRVLVCMPSVDLTVKSRIHTMSINQVVSESDLKAAYDQFTKEAILDDQVLINVNFTKFHINGITTRKVPLYEKCNTLTFESDCYYINRDVAFDYLKVIESTGLEVIDVVLDDLGFAKEAALFEQSINQPIIGVTLERAYTKLSLFVKGQLTTNIYTDYSVQALFDRFYDVYDFSDDIIERLVYYNLDVSNVSPSNDPVFAWNTKSKEHVLSQKDILDFVGNDIIQLLNDVHVTSSPIYEFGEASFVISGEAAIIDGLDKILESASDKEVSVYVPTTFGGKDVSFTSMLGVFYYYKDMVHYRQDTISSINEEEFYKRNIYQETKVEQKTDGFTDKLKNLFVD